MNLIDASDPHELHVQVCNAMYADQIHRVEFSVGDYEYPKVYIETHREASDARPSN